MAVKTMLAVSKAFQSLREAPPSAASGAGEGLFISYPDILHKDQRICLFQSLCEGLFISYLAQAMLAHFDLPFQSLREAPPSAASGAGEGLFISYEIVHA